ncbi:hypothetical protein HG536_0E04040 [Torulaspora globosa]|uniref:Uncharacterized protein n=1 Tax=Torulaspora globosa TaxID=48254 RepID=A0A7G3ZJ07_9SACH|nr:uncharacterized protein HG536_0E04040 [Torulaspora globosa]QLL33493.1 hypothetical protein HG536_0E04040 [Torulaspora globosa]
MATEWQPEAPPMSRLFVHTAELAQWVHCEEQPAAPVRYRLLGQLAEITTTGESIELHIRDLPEFGNAGQEGIRAVVGSRVYESRFVENAGVDKEIARAGCALSVCLGVVLQRDGTRILEVFDVQVLKRREIERLRYFICSSLGSELIRS